MNDTSVATRPLTAVEKAEIERALPEVRRQAKLMAWRCGGLELDELVAVGQAELTASVRRFDPTRGVSLCHFARKAMQGAMLRASRQRRRHPLGAALAAALTHAEAIEESVDLGAEISATDEERRARARALGADVALAAFCSYKAATATPSPEEELSAHQERAVLRETVADLGDGGALLDLLYFQGLDWEAAAAELGMSVSSARRLESKLLPRLRVALQSRGVLPEVA